MTLKVVPMKAKPIDEDCVHSAQVGVYLPGDAAQIFDFEVTEGKIIEGVNALAQDGVLSLRTVEGQFFVTTADALIYMRSEPRKEPSDVG